MLWALVIQQGMRKKESIGWPKYERYGFLPNLAQTNLLVNGLRGPSLAGIRAGQNFVYF